MVKRRRTEKAQNSQEERNMRRVRPAERWKDGCYVGRAMSGRVGCGGGEDRPDPEKRVQHGLIHLTGSLRLRLAGRSKRPVIIKGADNDDLSCPSIQSKLGHALLGIDA